MECTDTHPLDRLIAISIAMDEAESARSSTGVGSLKGDVDNGDGIAIKGLLRARCAREHRFFRQPFQQMFTFGVDKSIYLHGEGEEAGSFTFAERFGVT